MWTRSRQETHRGMSRARRRTSLAAAAAALACGLSTGATARAATEGEPQASEPTAGLQQQPSAPTAPPDRELSNDRTLTVWAHPAETAPIYVQPDTHSRRVASLHMETEDGFPEIYLLLASRTDSHGRTWVRLRVPGRPNGRIGWVRREALGGFQQTHWLISISLAKRHLIAYYRGRPRFSAPVGVGKPSSPTPPGRFWIRERFRLTSRSNPYWPYALGTSDYSTLTDWPGGGVVGIHGDFGQPELIPGDPSHGCVRMRDPDIAWLAPRITLGTPVDIH